MESGDRGGGELLIVWGLCLCIYLIVNKPTPIVPGHQLLTMAASRRGDRDTTAPPHPPSPWPCDQTELATTRLPASAPQRVEDWHIGGGGY